MPRKLALAFYVCMCLVSPSSSLHISPCCPCFPWEQVDRGRHRRGSMIDMATEQMITCKTQQYERAPINIWGQVSVELELYGVFHEEIKKSHGSDGTEPLSVLRTRDKRGTTSIATPAVGHPSRVERPGSILECNIEVGHQWPFP